MKIYAIEVDAAADPTKRVWYEIHWSNSNWGSPREYIQPDWACLTFDKSVAEKHIGFMNSFKKNPKLVEFELSRIEETSMKQNIS